MPEELKGFISYAHEDKKYLKIIKDKLKVHPQYLGDKAAVSLWSDAEIIVREEWNETIGYP